MRLLKRYGGGLLLLLGPVLAAPAGAAFQCTQAGTNEYSIRARALKTVMPEFSQAARRAGAQGVAVCELRRNERGDVTEVKVLEAPQAEIGAAVIRAVKQWKFKSMSGAATPYCFKGKLTFYFVIDSAGGHVRNPRRFS